MGGIYDNPMGLAIEQLMDQAAPPVLSEDSIEAAVVLTVSYFDIFLCAPTAREIHRFLIQKKVSREALADCLHRSPVLAEHVGSDSGFYFLKGKDHLVPRRIRFLEHSRRLWPEARRIAKLLDRSGLPTAGFVTGSLAADNADEHADIDFLLTYPKTRAWTSWALLRLMQKLPGVGLAKLCPNYALPDDKLEIRPQNLFTAWEIAKAVPLFGFDVYERFVRANAWVERYLPNSLPFLEANPPALELRPDPPLVRSITRSRLYERLESFERKRKFAKDTQDVGVNMRARTESGSVDRHSPTRSFITLSELRYRMEQAGLSSHPLFSEIEQSTTLLGGEMKQWGEDSLKSGSGRPGPKDNGASSPNLGARA